MLKKFVVIGLIGIGSLVNAKVNAVVSILPQTTFVKAIGGDKVDVSLMVKPGNSPHTYEPKPSQMRDISNADIYFSIGVEFEKVWLPKFANQNKKMKIVNIGKGIDKMEMVEHHHGEDTHHKEHEGHEHHDDHDGDHHEENGSFDPHVWTSPDNVRIMARNILKYLIKVDKANEEYYEANYETFEESLDSLDNRIKNILKETPRGAKFMVFHPAWGYFAKQYCLVQIPIEIEGKSPKPKDIIKIIKMAKEQNITAILTAPEFSDKVAKQIAKELDIQILKISPLNPKWSENLINLAKNIATK